MSSTILSKFIVNSDFPLPEQAGAARAVIVMPPGSTVPSRTIDTKTSVNSESRIFRIAFQCSRTGDKMYVSGQSFMNLQFEDGSFNIYVGAAKNGEIECSVMVYQGLDKSKTNLESDVTFTFYISGFKLP